MTEILHLKNINKTISTRFPKIQNNYILESSIENTYRDRYFPVNSYDIDNFVEFRVPKSIGIFTDLSEIYLQFNFNVKKQVYSDSDQWSSPVPTGSGDHYDVLNALGYTIFKHVILELNGVQCVNDTNYSLNSYIKLITNFSTEKYNKQGRLLHLQHYEKNYEKHTDDTYFTGLNPNSKIAKRLTDIRDNGVHVRVPLIFDITKVNSYLLDGVEMVLRLSLHDPSMVFITSQHNANAVNGNKKYSFSLSDISLNIKRIKPTINALNAFNSTLLRNSNIIQNINYPFTSHLTKQYHIPSGVNNYIIDLPFSNKIPEKIYIIFQKYSTYNTRDYKTNGLYLDNLNLNNILITINSATIYNIDCDFSTKNVTELYNTTLKAINNDNHLLDYDSFLEGTTLLGFNLTNYDEIANIRSPRYGVMRISLTFKTDLPEGAVIYLIGDSLAFLSVNDMREIILNKN